MKTYIEDLFVYLDRFETKATEFDTEAFLQTYSGISTVFEALREQRDKAVEIDQFFLAKIKQTRLDKSDLRLLTIQLLITYFEVQADTDGRSNQAYLYCRNQREIKQDVPYFERNLMPMLFADGALNWNLQLNTFFLEEIARYLNRYGSAVPADTTPEAFDALSEPSRILLLARRRLEFGNDIVKDRTMLEFHLQQVNAFNKLSQRGRVHREHLNNWGYLQTTSIWTRLSRWMREFAGKAGGVFSNWHYFRLVIRQRNAAYVLYVVVVLLCIGLIVYVPIKWKSYAGEKLQQIEQHASELQAKGGR